MNTLPSFMGTSDEDGDWPAGLSSVLSEKYLSWSWSWRSLELEKLKMTENDGDVAKSLRWSKSRASLGRNIFIQTTRGYDPPYLV